MSFIDTDDPFSIAAKRIRSSVIRSTPEPQLPIQGKQQPTTYIIEPDLMESQTGKMNLPNDVAFDDAGFAYNTVTGNPVQIVRRPNVLPIARTPEGFTFAMPKILDAASNIVGGVAAPAVATKAGEVVLGSGAVRKSLDESLITKAKEHFGITKEPKEAGYVLPDGSMLDLSGRHYATGYENINGRFVPKAGQPDYLKGTRSVDHREVADITDVGGTEGMRQFMNKTGAIRNQPGNGIDTTVIPTDQQLNRLISSHNSSYRGEPFTVDISNPITGENIASKTFEKPNVEKIKKWIADETAKYPTLYSDTRNQVYSEAGRQLEKAAQGPFYSALERTVDNAKIGKADANQWLGYLKNQPGVKQDELSWVLNNLPEGQISKQALSDIIKNNKIELKEVVKGGSSGTKEKAFELAKEHGWKSWDDIDADTQAKYMRRAAVEGGATPTKYHGYQLPGGENYQEMLLTLPSRTQDGRNQFASLIEKYGLEEATKRIKDLPETKFGGDYKSSHWDEPNILAHVRYNDRNIPDVGKSLHLEEIQSDWHQAGRKQGYRQDQEKQMADLVSQRDAIKAERDKYAPTGDTRAKWIELDDKMAPIQEKINELGKSDVGVPDAPFKKNWDELAFKRMLHKAANEGYDSVSWTPGEAQAARYDLSKQISKITYNAPGSKAADKYGTVLKAYDHNGHEVINKAAKPEELADLIGKEAAEKLLKTEAKNDKHELAGLDLKVGGEGMKSFYDKMLVDKANALAKKYGAKVETKNVNNDNLMVMQLGGDEPYHVYTHTQNGIKPVSKFKTDKEAQDFINKNQQPVHVLKLTPELRAKAKEGFPLFSSTPITTPVDYDPFNNNKKYKLTPIEGNPFQ